MTPSPEILGFASATIASASVIPQIIKSWRTRSSKDISTPMILMTYIAVTLGIIYGFIIHHVAIYVGNSVTLILYLTLHLVKIRNQGEKQVVCTEGVELVTV